MKDFIRFIGLIAVGLLTAIFLYPFLHEIGHSMATMLVGGRVADLKFFPLPSVMCETNILDSFEVAFIGLSGMIFPYMLSLIAPRKQFWLWYLWLAISVICLISFSISIVGVFLYKVGNPLLNEDITQVMFYADEYYILYLAILIGLLIFRTIQIVRTKPIKRCLDGFGV